MAHREFVASFGINEEQMSPVIEGPETYTNYPDYVKVASERLSQFAWFSDEAEDILFPKDGDDHPSTLEVSIINWLSLVSLDPEGVSRVSSDLSPVKGLGIQQSLSLEGQTTQELNFQEDRLPKDVLHETSRISLLSSVAVSRAKLLAIGELAEGTYPALIPQIKAYTEYLDDLTEVALETKQSSLSPLTLLAHPRLDRRLVGLSSAVIIALLLSGCGQGTTDRPPIDATPPQFPTHEVGEPSTTIQPTPEIIPTKTQMPTEVAPTQTESPTATMTATATETAIPEPELRAYWFPERIEECQQNEIRYDHIEEDLTRLTDAERTNSVITTDMINMGATPSNFAHGTTWEPFLFSSRLYVTYKELDTPYISSCSAVKLPSGETRYIVGIPVMGHDKDGSDGNIHYIHVMYDDEVTQSATSDNYPNIAIEEQYRHFSEGGSFRLLGVDLYLTEPGSGEFMRGKEKYQVFYELFDLMTSKGITDTLINRAFFYGQPPLTTEEWDLLETTIIPARIIVAFEYQGFEW